MSAINVDQLFQTLETGIECLAKRSLNDYVSHAETDGQAIICGMKTNLQIWAQEVEDGTLTPDDLEFLLEGQIALNSMVALKEAGLAEVRIDEFRSGIVSMILGSITKVCL